MSPASDTELLERWASDEGECGRELVRRHFRTVFRFFQNKAGHEVHDLTQRTFTACLEARDSFEGRSSFRTFLLGIANNQLRRFLVERYREQRRQSQLETLSVSELLGQRPASPTERLAQRAEHKLLLTALRQLPWRLQVVLELRFWEELSTAEMAKILGVAEGTVGSRLSRAKDVLRAMVRSLEPGDLAESTLGGLERWAGELAEMVSREPVEKEQA